MNIILTRNYEILGETTSYSDVEKLYGTGRHLQNYWEVQEDFIQSLYEVYNSNYLVNIPNFEMSKPDYMEFNDLLAPIVSQLCKKGYIVKSVSSGLDHINMSEFKIEFEDWVRIPEKFKTYFTYNRGIFIDLYSGFINDKHLAPLLSNQNILKFVLDKLTEIRNWVYSLPMYRLNDEILLRAYNYQSRYFSFNNFSKFYNVLMKQPFYMYKDHNYIKFAYCLFKLIYKNICYIIDDIDENEKFDYLLSILEDNNFIMILNTDINNTIVSVDASHYLPVGSFDKFFTNIDYIFYNALQTHFYNNDCADYQLSQNLLSLKSAAEMIRG